MPKTSEYKERAEECVLLAQSVDSSTQRTMLLHIAETWLRLAEDESSHRTMQDGFSHSLN